MKALSILRYLGKLDFKNSSTIVEDILFDPKSDCIILTCIIIKHKPTVDSPVGIRRGEIILQNGGELIELIRKSSKLS